MDFWKKFYPRFHYDLLELSDVISNCGLLLSEAQPSLECLHFLKKNFCSSVCLLFVASGTKNESRPLSAVLGNLVCSWH